MKTTQEQADFANMSKKQLEAKFLAMESLIIELTLITYEGASVLEKRRLDNLLSALQFAGFEESPIEQKK